MAESDLVSVRGQVMEYTHIPTGIKGEMVRSGVNCHWKGQVVGTVGRRPVAIHSTGRTISILTTSSPSSAPSPPPFPLISCSSPLMPPPCLPTSLILMASLLLRSSYLNTLLPCFKFPRIPHSLHPYPKLLLLQHLQAKGTAMGNRMAPSYANLFKGSLEEDFLNSEDSKPDLYLATARRHRRRIKMQKRDE